ncbi:MAG: hypothetical protein ACXQTW_02120, partial [Candidatus Methanospirareceae archaeon]
MKGKDKVIAIVTIIVIITATAVIFAYADINMENSNSIKAHSKVDLTAKWTITEGKYSPIDVSVGDILYGKNGTVQIKIEEIEIVKGEDREKQKLPYTIIKDAKGIVLKGEDKVEVGMELYLVENP